MFRRFAVTETPGKRAMEGEMTTLADIHRVATAKGSGYFGPVRCCIVGFVADNDFPRRFVYRGCTEKKSRGICKISVEGPESRHCEHNALVRGCFSHYFCFQLAFSDESLLHTYGKMGMRASIWEAATTILNVTAVSMAQMEEVDQFKLLYECLKDIPLCDVDFRVTNGDISVTELEVVSLSSTLPECRAWKSAHGTPRRPKLSGEFQTPEKPISQQEGSSQAGDKPRGLSAVVRDLAGALSQSLDFYSASNQRSDK